MPRHIGHMPPTGREMRRARARPAQPGCRPHRLQATARRAARRARSRPSTPVSPPKTCSRVRPVRGQLETYEGPPREIGARSGRRLQLAVLLGRVVTRGMVRLRRLRLSRLSRPPLTVVRGGGDIPFGLRHCFSSVRVVGSCLSMRSTPKPGAYPLGPVGNRSTEPLTLPLSGRGRPQRGVRATPCRRVRPLPDVCRRARPSWPTPDPRADGTAGRQRSQPETRPAPAGCGRG